VEAELVLCPGVSGHLPNVAYLAPEVFLQAQLLLLLDPPVLVCLAFGRGFENASRGMKTLLARVPALDSIVVGT